MESDASLAIKRWEIFLLDMLLPLSNKHPNRQLGSSFWLLEAADYGIGIVGKKGVFAGKQTLCHKEPKAQSSAIKFHL